MTWIYIQREHSNDLMIGPYETESTAVHAMEHSNLIEGLCQEDCLECFTTDDEPTTKDVLTVDLEDPDHTGIGGDDDFEFLMIFDVEVKSAKKVEVKACHNHR